MVFPIMWVRKAPQIDVFGSIAIAVWAVGLAKPGLLTWFGWMVGLHCSRGLCFGLVLAGRAWVLPQLPFRALVSTAVQSTE